MSDVLMGATDRNESQQLCMACGMCCDGTLFGYAPIQSDEPVADYLEAGLIIEKCGASSCSRQEGTRVGGAKYQMPQPCNQLRDGKCQSYGCRPRACQQFICRLHDRTRVSHDEALQVIATAKAKRACVERLLQEHFPSLASRPLPQALAELDRQMADQNEEESRRFRFRHFQFLIERAALRFYLITQVLTETAGEECRMTNGESRNED